VLGGQALGSPTLLGGVAGDGKSIEFLAHGHGAGS